MDYEDNTYYEEHEVEFFKYYEYLKELEQEEK